MVVRWMADAVRLSKLTFRDMQNIIESIVSCFRACQLTSTHNTTKYPGTYFQGKRPGDYWVVDFIEIKPERYGYNYLLVFVNIFSRRMEAFTTKTETAKAVANKLLEEILSRCGFPHMIGSESRPESVSKI